MSHNIWIIMKNRKHYIILLILAVAASIALLVSCGMQSEEQIKLGNDLTVLLNNAPRPEGSKAGLAYFIMPVDNDWKNIPQDPKNPITKAKVELGKLLFHEPALSAGPKCKTWENQASCASCHHAAAGFYAGVPQGIGTGGMGFGKKGEGRTKDPNCPEPDLEVSCIRASTVMNLAWQKNLLYNGLFGATGMNKGTDSLWKPGTAQEKNKLGYEGLEAASIGGQGIHWMDISFSKIKGNTEYKKMFADAFPEIPENTRINEVTAGLAMAAYQRTIISNQAPFQKWLNGEKNALTTNQLKGAMVFFGKGNCKECHTGPALSSMNFHAMAMNDLSGPGVYRIDPKSGKHKGRGAFTGNPADLYKFKVPQLYNLVDSKYYGHGSSFHSVKEVVEYMNNARPQNAIVPSTHIATEFVPLNLKPDEINYLVDFIENALYDKDLMRFAPKSLPTKHGIPNNDPKSIKDYSMLSK